MISTSIFLWVVGPLLVAVAALGWLLTRRRRGEADSAALAREAFRSSPDSITVGRLRDGRLLEVNEGFECISGFARSEALGKTLLELGIWSEEDRLRLRAVLESEGRVENMELSVRDKHGRQLECQISCEVVDFKGEPCLVGVTRDISALKVIERRLQASEQKFAKAFRSSPDSITISRLSDGLFLDVNEGFQNLSGYSYDAAVGKTGPELGLWHGNDRERAVEVLGREGRLSNLEVRYRMKSGEVRDFLLSAEVVELEGEQCMVAISRDVSHLKAVEREREELIERLEAQNAELERFTYTVSHDLKSPLVTILGFLGLVEKESAAGKTEEVAAACSRIRVAAQTMERHLKELLDLSRIGRAMNPPEPVPLTEVAREAAEHLAGLLEVHGARLEIPDGLPVVMADRSRLLEVLQNLIENAVKFAVEGKAPTIEVGAKRQDGLVVCHVKDDGVGLAPQHLERVFGLFERLDQKVEGSGVGLALVKRIVEVHGGRIWIESDGPGCGAAVFFELPGS